MDLKIKKKKKKKKKKNGLNRFNVRLRVDLIFSKIDHDL